MTAAARTASMGAHLNVCILSILIALSLIACVNPTQRMKTISRNADAKDIIIHGDYFQHILIRNRADLGKPSSKVVLLFLEGDGSPWTHNGAAPSTDPSSRKLLALQLLLNTDQPAWYLSRPCYNNLREHCDSSDWTHGRYSERIVSSMTSAIRSQLKEQPYEKVILVGYSGGGVLATLIAARMPEVAGVITIAANLDIQAWAHLHQYEPLTLSLNPSDLHTLAIPQIVLSGDRDNNVPLASIKRYLEHQPKALVQRLEGYDHVCCWLRDWPALLSSSLQQIDKLSR